MFWAFCNKKNGSEQGTSASSQPLCALGLDHALLMSSWILLHPYKSCPLSYEETSLARIHWKAGLSWTLKSHLQQPVFLFGEDGDKKA